MTTNQLTVLTIVMWLAVIVVWADLIVWRVTP